MKNVVQQFLENPPDGQVHIAVDHRESPDFDRALSKLGAVVDRRVLDVGDFLCSARLVIERKTRSDFEQSVIDGRLFSQLQNLRENYESVIVLVEGESNEGRLSRNAVLGAYASIIADFGASLIFTRDITATTEIVFNFAKHEQIAKKQAMRIYAKRKTFTPSQTARAVIESLPMIGPKTAKSILNHFGTIERVANANERELAEVEGVGPKRAKVIRALFGYEYRADEDRSEY